MTKIAGLLMAAGNSRRMGGPNKLLMPFQSQMLIGFAVAALNGANLAKRALITGRDNIEVQKHARNYDIVHNPNFLDGFGTSLAAGFSVMQTVSEIDGALVMLADMPLITAAHLDKMIEAFTGTSIIRAAHQGKPGNPVILPKALFKDMAKLDGEQSGQAVIKASGLPVVFVEIGPAALADADTPEAFAALQEAHL